MAKGQKQAADKQLGVSNQYAAAGNQRANDIFSSLYPTLTGQYTNPMGLGTPNAAVSSDGATITNPTGLSNTAGFSQGDKNAMTTASNQALGGAVGAAVGQGNQQASHTNNAAGYSNALDEAVRTAGRQQSQNALGVQEDSAKLAAEQGQASDQLKQQEVMKNAELGTNRNISNAQLQAQQNESDANLKAAQRSQALSGMEGLYGESMQQLLSSLGLGPGTLNARAQGQSGFQQFMQGMGALGADASGSASIMKEM